jgi:hypothetical protein
MAEEVMMRIVMWPHHVTPDGMLLADTQPELAVLASDYDAAVARAEKAEKEIEALRNLANNLQPGPISEALVGERYTREAALTARVAALEAGLIDAEALLCDEHGGPAANECAARLRALLGAKP